MGIKTDMLERIVKRGPILELSLLASGGRSSSALEALRREGLVQRCDHPTVKEPGGWAAPAMEATPAGRAALEEHRRKG